MQSIPEVIKYEVFYSKEYKDKFFIFESYLDKETCNILVEER